MGLPRSGEITDKPRIGIPWRTLAEETSGKRQKLEYYLEAVRKAGGEPVEVSLQLAPEQFVPQVKDLDGFILPGSPADVEPERFGQARHPKTNEIDQAREAADSAILKHALAAGKPVLGICYGCQMLNVYLGGSLAQDIRSAKSGALVHGITDLPVGAARGDLEHRAKLQTGSWLAERAGSGEAKVNSSHHQAIERPGEGLKVTAVSPEDGVVEGVERIGGGDWLVGVQWHPERMEGDAFAERLFREFVSVARAASAREAAGKRS